MKPRLGAVPYLNTRPLVVALERDPAPFALSYSVPSRCARELADGTIDVGIIPAIEYARSTRPYWIVPDIAIGSQGPVLTVRLFCRRPLPQVERIALDTSSRTSVALLSILLREKFALTPQLIEAPPDLGAMLECADAALLIGDQVFPHLDGDMESLDLGREWTGYDRFAFCVCLLGWPPAGAHARPSPTIAAGQRSGGMPSAVHRRSAQPRMRRLARVLRALPDPPHPL